MKYCTRCKQNKDFEDFRPNKRTKDGYQKYCITCDKEYQKEWYLKNKEKHKSKSKISNLVRKKRNIKFVLEYFKNNPCSKCGETDPVVLDFDHLGDKKYQVARLVGGSSIDKIKSEIAKCQVLCANCHRRKTAKDFNWYKMVL